MNCEQNELNVKVDLNGEKIRFMLKGETSYLLTELQKKIEKSFGVESGFILKYQDDEGDFITIANESDLEMAMSLYPNVLRLIVDPKQQQQQQQEQEQEENSSIQPTTTIITTNNNNNTTSANFMMKNHKMVMINLNTEKMDLVGLSNICDSQLTEKLKKWTLKELVLVGLVTKDHALELCQQTGVKPPKCCFGYDSSLFKIKKKKDHNSFRITQKNNKKNNKHHRHHHHHHHRKQEDEVITEKIHVHGNHHHHHKKRLECKPLRKGGERRYRIWKQQQQQDNLLNKLSSLTFTDKKKEQIIEKSQEQLMNTNKEKEEEENNTITKTNWYDRNIKIARFINHVNFPRNHIISFPGETIQKTWRMKNDSTIAWPQNCEIVFHKGDNELSIPTVTPFIGEVLPGSEVDISISLVTPTKCGYYQGSWRLRDSTNGKMFGERVWTSLIVKNQTSTSSEMEIEHKNDESQENVNP